MRSALKRLALYSLAALLVSGCAGRQTNETMTLLQRAQMHLSYTQAEKLLQEDKPVAAAELLWENAMKLPPPHRQEMQVRTAEILLDHHYHLAAYRYLTQIDEAAIPTELLLKKRIADARFYDQSSQYERVVTALPDALIADADAAGKIAAMQLLATALAYTYQVIKGINTRLKLDSLLSEEQRTANIISLWRMIATMEPRMARNELGNAPSKDAAAWLHLALLATPETSDIAQTEEAFAAWKEQNQRWKLPEQIEDELRSRWHYLNFSPGKVAVMLPLTGVNAKYGRIIRDGMISAHQHHEQSASMPTRILQFYNTDIEDITTLYRTAITNEAEIIIGPLLKPNVEKLLTHATAEVPVITLNYVNSELPRQQEIFQFGLLPEDEGMQIATKIHDSGYRFTIVLTPDNNWGERLSGAFINHYLDLGGKIRQIIRYTPSLVDYTPVIEDAFQLDESRQRQRQLSKTLNQKPEFSPRIRSDIDSAVLFAGHRNATMIYPQMKYHYVDKLPTYANSEVYTPSANPKNRDLDGLIYCDVPAILSRHNNMFDDKVNHPDFRLFALGVDSYNLITNFRRMNIARIAYHGLTGELTVKRDRRLFRKLRWARFQNGKPVPLNPLQ